MSKLTKLLNKPGLFFLDAVKKRTKDKKNSSNNSTLSKEKESKSWEKLSKKKIELPISEMVNRTRTLINSGCRAPQAERFFIRRKWDICGPCQETIDDINFILKKQKFMSDSHRYKMLLFKAAIMTEASDTASIGKILMTLTKKGTEHQWPQFPLALGEQIYKLGISEQSIFKNCTEYMDKTRQHEGHFHNILRNKNLSIAIVGNSPIELGKGKGKEIDKHDVVIRFNNYSDSNEYSEDYGTKTNIWVRSAKHIDIWRRHTGNYDMVIFSGPDKRYHAMGASDIMEVLDYGTKTGFIPTNIYAELIKELDYPPSAGLLMLYWIYKIRGNFSSNNVSAYGFSMNDQKPNSNNQYFKVDIKKARYSHNWEAEASYYQRKILGRFDNNILSFTDYAEEAA